jgi:hypothetical protein
MYQDSILNANLSGYEQGAGWMGAVYFSEMKKRMKSSLHFDKVEHTVRTS